MVLASTGALAGGITCQSIIYSTQVRCNIDVGVGLDMCAGRHGVIIDTGGKYNRQ